MAATLPTGIQVGQGVRTVSASAIHSQGTLAQTEGAIDLAIEGDGFFQIQRPNGELAYTRAGNFHRDQDGRMVTVDGFAIEPSITIPQDSTSITITADGTVSATTEPTSLHKKSGKSSFR